MIRIKRAFGLARRADQLGGECARDGKERGSQRQLAEEVAAVFKAEWSVRFQRKIIHIHNDFSYPDPVTEQVRAAETICSNLPTQMNGVDKDDLRGQDWVL